MFRASDDFVGRAQGAYRLLPFRFLRTPRESVLVTNEVGEFEFLTARDFAAFVTHTLAPDSPPYLELKSKHFLADSDSVLPLEMLATKVRTKRSFLDGFTRLHILVTTLRCDHSCGYCQVSRVSQDRKRFDMSLETAARAVDWVFMSPANELKIEFQGGEPTLNWPVIAAVVEASETRAASEGRSVQFVIASNLSSITTDMLEFCRLHGIHISSSLDGPASLHNANRPRPGDDSYARFRANLALARSVLGHDGVSALMTTTPAALAQPTKIIDEYLELGFDSIFLRPISPYGFAIKTRLDRAYRVPAFLDFYRAGTNYIIDVNRRGVPFVETYSQILLRKILTPFAVGYVDLQSPAGAALGVLVYNYDGDVYASDEGRMLAEMGDRSFRLGNLDHDLYSDVMSGPRVHALAQNSCLETMPGCSECAYVPYCGADPVFNWASQGDVVGHRPTSEFCTRQTGVFEYLFDHLCGDDPFIRNLFLGWATR